MFFLVGDAQAYCFSEAAARYRVNEIILRSIAFTESKMDPLATKNNKNGTHDIGLMQINSSHLRELSKFGITERILYTEPCTNVNVGAWILAKSMAIHGNTWKAVGSYNTGPRGAADKQIVYAKKIIRNLEMGRH